MVEQCGAPRGTVRLEQDELLIFPADDIRLTGCVLERLQATGETTLSSVGNERYEVSSER